MSTPAEGKNKKRKPSAPKVFGPSQQTLHQHLDVQKPRYSARNTAMILVRFTTVGRCMFSSVSSSVCQNCGKGVAMTCSTGTPLRRKRKMVTMTDNMLYCRLLTNNILRKKLFDTVYSQIPPTFVKEGDVVVLHRSEVNVFPKIRLLRGVRRQETLSVESLL